MASLFTPYEKELIQRSLLKRSALRELGIDIAQIIEDAEESAELAEAIAEAVEAAVADPFSVGILKMRAANTLKWQNFGGTEIMELKSDGRLNLKAAPYSGETGGDARATFATDLQFFRADGSQVPKGYSSGLFAGEENKIAGDGIQEGTGWLSTVVGGWRHEINLARGAAILGGSEHLVKASLSAIIGGESNTIEGTGTPLTAFGPSAASVILGGWQNKIDATDSEHIILGGENNTINGFVADLIAASWGSTIGPDVSNSVILGGQNNEIAGSVSGALVAGTNMKVSATGAMALGSSGILNENSTSESLLLSFPNGVRLDVGGIGVVGGVGAFRDDGVILGVYLNGESSQIIANDVDGDPTVLIDGQTGHVQANGNVSAGNGYFTLRADGALVGTGVNPTRTFAFDTNYLSGMDLYEDHTWFYANGQPFQMDQQTAAIDILEFTSTLGSMARILEDGTFQTNGVQINPTNSHVTFKDVLGVPVWAYGPASNNTFGATERSIAGRPNLFLEADTDGELVFVNELWSSYLTIPNDAGNGPMAGNTLALDGPNGGMSVNPDGMGLRGKHINFGNTWIDSLSNNAALSKGINSAFFQTGDKGLICGFYPFGLGAMYPYTPTLFLSVAFEIFGVYYNGTFIYHGEARVMLDADSPLVDGMPIGLGHARGTGRMADHGQILGFLIDTTPDVDGLYPVIVDPQIYQTPGTLEAGHVTVSDYQQPGTTNFLHNLSPFGDVAAYLSFDEAAGNLTVPPLCTAAGTVFTATGAPVYSQEAPLGLGTAIEFPTGAGLTTTVDVSSLNPGTSNFVIEAWVKNAVSTNKTIIEKQPVGPTAGWQLSETFDTYFVYITDGVNDVQVFAPTGSNIVGEWQRIRVTFNNGTNTATIQVDDGPVVSGTSAGNIGSVTNTNPVRIAGATFDPWEGSIADLRITIGNDTNDAGYVPIKQEWTNLVGDTVARMKGDGFLELLQANRGLKFVNSTIIDDSVSSRTDWFSETGHLVLRTTGPWDLGISMGGNINADCLGNFSMLPVGSVVMTSGPGQGTNLSSGDAFSIYAGTDFSIYAENVVTITSAAPDSATVVAHIFDTAVNLFTPGAKLLSIRNFGTEVMSVDVGSHFLSIDNIHGHTPGGALGLFGQAANQGFYLVDLTDDNIYLMLDPAASSGPGISYGYGTQADRIRLWGGPAQRAGIEVDATGNTVLHSDEGISTGGIQLDVDGQIIRFNVGGALVATFDGAEQALRIASGKNLEAGNIYAPTGTNLFLGLYSAAASIQFDGTSNEILFTEGSSLQLTLTSTETDFGGFFNGFPSLKANTSLDIFAGPGGYTEMGVVNAAGTAFSYFQARDNGGTPDIVLGAFDAGGETNIVISPGGMTIGVNAGGTPQIDVGGTPTLTTFFGNVRLPVKTDATRGAAGTAGRIIFNSDDGLLNIDDGTDWTFADGTVT